MSCKGDCHCCCCRPSEPLSGGGFAFLIAFGLCCAGFVFPVLLVGLIVWMMYLVCNGGGPKECQIQEPVRATSIDEILAEIRYGKRHEDDFWLETKEEKEKRESSV